MARCADQLRAWRAVLHYEPCCPRATKRTLAAAAVTAAATAVLLLAALLVWRRPAAEPGAECRTRDTGQVASAGYTSLYSVQYPRVRSAACSPSRTRGWSTAPAPRRTTAAWPGAAPPRTTGGATWPGAGATAKRTVPWVGWSQLSMYIDVKIGGPHWLCSMYESPWCQAAGPCRARGRGSSACSPSSGRGACTARAPPTPTTACSGAPQTPTPPTTCRKARGATARPRVPAAAPRAARPATSPSARTT